MQALTRKAGAAPVGPAILLDKLSKVDRLDSMHDIRTLREQGRSYNEIVKITGLSKSTVVYHSSEERKDYYRKKRKRNFSEFKKQLKTAAGGCCQVCGYSKCLEALHFHHIDPSNKRVYGKIRGVMCISKSKSKNACIEEAKKCALLCPNCHAEAEAGLITVLSSVSSVQLEQLAYT